MDLTRLKFLYVVFIVYALSLPCTAALITSKTVTVPLPCDSCKHVCTSELLSPLISDVAAAQFSTNLRNTPEETKIAHSSTTRSGPATAAVALIGFLVVSLVRDRKTWAAIAYLIVIHPVVAEAHNLDRLVRHVRLESFEKYVITAVDLSPCHKYAQTEVKQHYGRSWLNHTAVFYRSTTHESEQFQVIQFTTKTDLSLEATPQVQFRAQNVPLFKGRLFTPNIFSRPPPASGNICVCKHIDV